MDLINYYRNLLSRGSLLRDGAARFSEEDVSRATVQLAARWTKAQTPQRAEPPAEVQEILDVGKSVIQRLNAGDSNISPDSPELLQALENFARIDGSRPLAALTASAPPVAAGFPGCTDFWKSGQPEFQRAGACTGEVLVPGNPAGSIGTGFVIAEDKVILPRGTLDMAASQETGGKWRIFDGAAIDFGGSAPGRRRISEVVFCSPSTGISGFAVVQLKPSGTPAAVPPQFSGEDDLEAGAEILVVGFPGGADAGEDPPTLIDLLFAPLYGVKVAAAGTITGFSTADGFDLIEHDATVLRGSQGALVVAADKPGVAVGMQLRSTTSGRRQSWCLRLSQALKVRDESTGQTLAETLSGLAHAPLLPPQPDDNEKPEVVESGPDGLPDIAELQREYLRFTESLETCRTWQWKRSELPDNDQSRTSEHFERAEEVAAVSGSFHPDELIASAASQCAGLSLEVQMALLSQLSTYCDTGDTSDKQYWLLQPERRQVVLNRLIQLNALQPLVSNVNSLPHTGRFGNLLREVLSATGETPAGETVEDLLLLDEIAGIVSELDLPHVDQSRLSPGIIHGRLRKADFLKEYEILLTGFVGREEELGRLRAFLDASTDESSNYDFLTVKGTGGAGKSSLMAQFALDVYRQHCATIVVLDLDRPGINLGDHQWLNMEIARQVGSQYPQTIELLREARQAIRDQAQQSADSSNTALEAVAETEMRTHSIAQSIHTALQNAGAADRPVLLIFDTFEIAMRNPLHLSNLKDWLADLGEYLHPVQLRVIFSGREFENAELSSPSGEITVTELPCEIAIQLLERQGVESELASEIVDLDVLPNRPLELKLIAQLVSEDGDFDVHALKQELSGAPEAGEGGSEAQEMLKAGLIYRRILNRIDSPVAQKLAFPGLVLRYVTAELVHQVLSPALELDLTEEEAREAFEELRSYTWLLEQRDGHFWHRSDMRELMMALLSGAEQETADRISQRAAGFFEERNGPGDQQEAVYHRLRLVRAPDDIPEGAAYFNKELLGAFSPELLKNEGKNLSLPAQVLVKWAHDDPIPEDQVMALPREYLPGAFESAGKRLVAANEFAKAADLVDRGRQEGIQSADHYSGWEVEAMFNTCRWPALRELLESRSGFLSTPPGDAATIAGALFPRYLIDGRSPAPAWLESQLVAVSQSQQYGDIEQAATIASRMAVALMMINHHQQLTQECGAASMRLLDGLMAGLEKLPSAVADNRIRLLRLALRNDGATQAMLAPSTLKIDPQWLEHNAERVKDYSPDLAEMLENVHSALVRFQSQDRRTARSLLSKVTAFSEERSRWHDSAFTLSPAEEWFAGLLRGCDWEFRTPLEHVLGRLYAEPRDRRRLAEMLAALIPFDLTDLAPDVFARLVAADPQNALAPFVEVVDRCWKMHELIDQVAREFPGDAQLADLRNEYGSWRKAADNAFATAREHALQTQPKKTEAEKTGPDKGPAKKPRAEKTPRKKTSAKKKVIKKKAINKKPVKKKPVKKKSRKEMTSKTKTAAEKSVKKKTK